jgi:FKBP-type peptidyl-prolyl cis-trans isomerase SlyD
MREEPVVIVDDMVVDMVYVLHSQTGREIDRSVNPIAFIQGHDQVLPGLANALYGMSAGEEKTILVTPADGYGAYDEDNRQRVPRSILSPSSPLWLGQGVNLRNHETGQTYQAHVIEIGPEHIVLDHNLPLAGQTLYFHVWIVGVRRATVAELADGLP